ncbi:MAG: hypothetical protein [Bacteriophage sp.]|nr:MAG: hypothetical protein [Bacteriophage sp.]
MYKMSKRSLAIRLAIVPLVIPLWFVGLIILTLSLIFEKLGDVVEYCRDKFEDWVNRIAPLGK